MAEKYMEVDLLKMAIEAEPFFTDSTKAAFRNIVNKVPAVDAVEVVRCKDCKNYGDEYFCPLRSLADYTDPNDYCSMGERREDDG